MYYYIKNIEEDIIGITDSNNNILCSYVYDSWGNIISINNNGNIITDTSHIGIINPYRYRSYYYDSEAKLYYLNSRYYNPEWGRFINCDGIIGANMNKRLIALLIDFMLFTILFNILCVEYFNYNIISINLFLKPKIILCIILLLSKDLLFKNASIGKKIMKIEVRTLDGNVPSKLVLILRNIAIIIWPIEVLLIVLLNNRIGDMIFKTKVIDKNSKILKENKISVEARRAWALIIDLILIINITTIIYLIYIKVANYTSIDQFEYLVLSWVILLVFKDIIFKNASIGKKIMKIEIKTINDKKPILLVIILRNLTIIVGTLEIILIMLSNKRLGDYLFDTKIVLSNE